MINIELKEIHIGKAIKERLEELRMSKSEFGRLIGVPQQHINRILERDTIETRKLIKICRALDYNFFSLFCIFPTNISAYLSAIAMGNGNANNNLGESALLSELEVMKVKQEKDDEIIRDLRERIAELNASVEMLRSNLNDKDQIIKLLKEK